MTRVNVDVEQIANKVIELFLQHIDNRDIKIHTGEQLRNFEVTRSLAAYAVYWKNACSIADASGAITDGQGDNGIDAIYYNESNKRLTIVQSKFIKDGNSEPEAAELRAFRDGVFDLIEGNINSFNEKIKSKQDIINKIKEFGTKVDIILVYTSREKLAEPANEIIRKMMLDLNGSDEEDGVFTFHLLHKKRIISSLTQALGGNEIKLEFLLKDFGLIKEPLLSYYGKINGSKLKEWWDSHNDLLFRDNIRNSLGNTTVNSIIEKTIEERPDYFWFFNNGVTVIADKISKTAENGNNKDFGYFKAENASIVNGAQTYSTIGKCGVKGINIDKVEVPFRVIQVNKDSKELKQEITRYNNTQNTILPKDFLSQNEVQVALQEKLALSGYKYVIKRDSTSVNGEKIFDFDEVTEALVSTSNNPGSAAIYKKEIGRFYNTDSNLYKSLYINTINAYRVVNSVNINRKLKQSLPKVAADLSRKEPSLPKVSNIANSGSILIAQCLFKRLNTEIQASLDQSLCGISYNEREIEEILKAVVIYISEKYSSNYIVTLFQNVDKVKEIYELAS